MSNPTETCSKCGKPINAGEPVAQATDLCHTCFVQQHDCFDAAGHDHGGWPTVHAYAQPLPHAPTYLVANRAGLRKLRDAIDDAFSGRVGLAAVTCNDGEGYDVYVVEVKSNELLDKMALPYTEGWAAALNDESRVWPHQLKYLAERAASVIATRKKFDAALETARAREDARTAVPPGPAAPPAGDGAPPGG